MVFYILMVLLHLEKYHISPFMDIISSYFLLFDALMMSFHLYS